MSQRPNPLQHALGYRDFRLLWLGQATSLLGDQFYIVATPWLVLKLTHDPLALGVALALAALPRAAVMLVGGAVTDRFSPRRIMLISDALRLALTCLVVALVATGAIQIWWLYALSLAFGLISGFFLPASSSIMPRLVPADDLQAGNAVFQGSSQLIGFIGPALAGAVIGASGGSLGGLALAFGVDALTFVASIMTLVCMRSERLSTRPATAAGSMWQSIQAGIRYAWEDGFLRLIFIVVALANLLFAGPVVVGVPVLASQRLPEGAAAFGLILSAYAGGNLLGILLCGALPRPSGRRMKAFLVALLALFGLGLVGLGFITNTWVGFGLMLCLGVGNGYFGITLITALQQRTPKEMMGRLVSLAMLANLGLIPISQMLSGALSRYSLVVLFGLAGAGLLLLSGWLAIQPALNQMGAALGEAASEVAGEALTASEGVMPAESTHGPRPPSKPISGGDAHDPRKDKQWCHNGCPSSI